MDRHDPPPTEEGWYALHDLRRVDWDAWRSAPERERDRALEEGRTYLEGAIALADAEAGSTAVYSVLGDEADLMLVHLRPATADLDALQRRLETTALGAYLERAGSYVSVTEASGYSERARAYFEDDLDEDSGLARYIEARLYPDLPDAAHCCFYPMSKRREPDQNWYDLPFGERAKHMDAHGEIGRDYGGRVTQMITGSIGFEDHEWGVTLFADDPTDVKDLLYEMRFDPSTSKFAEFGPFYMARRMAPADLTALFAGEPVPTADADEAGTEAGATEGTHPADEGAGSDRPDSHGGDEDLRSTLEAEGVYAGQPTGEDVHALVCYSEAEVDELFDAVDGLRSNFDHYDTHVTTAVYEPVGDGGAAETAVVSIWETEDAAETAGGFLVDLPGVVRTAREDGDGWDTMGMFYTVKPDHREDFRATFGDVADQLAGMDGHRETTLLANHEDGDDMFIASRWDAREDAMEFFRSEAFADTVEWGREVLADRPRHVYLA